tara:strand:- start:5781 stop:6164 length:384 start_codon:yes stop_codon:yes gene_type:complete
MVRDLIQWNLSEDKCFEIINLTLIDILSGSPNKTLSLNRLVELLNSRTRIYKINNQKKYNSFSKYLKLKHKGILNFIEEYNFYGVDKTNKNIQIKLYKNLINMNELGKINKRVTKDSEWEFIDEDDI